MDFKKFGNFNWIEMDSKNLDLTRKINPFLSISIHFRLLDWSIIIKYFFHICLWLVNLLLLISDLWLIVEWSTHKDWCTNICRLNSIKRICAHFVTVYVTWTIDKYAHMRFTESSCSMSTAYDVRILHMTYYIRLHWSLCVDLRFCRKQLRQSLCLGPYPSLDVKQRWNAQ